MRRNRGPAERRVEDPARPSRSCARRKTSRRRPHSLRPRRRKPDEISSGPRPRLDDALAITRKVGDLAFEVRALSYSRFPARAPQHPRGASALRRGAAAHPPPRRRAVSEARVLGTIGASTSKTASPEPCRGLLRRGADALPDRRRAAAARLQGRQGLVAGSRRARHRARKSLDGRETRPEQEVGDLFSRGPRAQLPRHASECARIRAMPPRSRSRGRAVAARQRERSLMLTAQDAEDGAEVRLEPPPAEGIRCTDEAWDARCASRPARHAVGGDYSQRAGLRLRPKQTPLPV